MEITTACIPGQLNQLIIDHIEPQGAYLADGAGQQILLPSKWVPRRSKIGDVLNVFVYFDSEDRPIATTQTPLAKAGEVAYLEVVDVNQTGAFLNWGLEKDLLVPFREQKQRMEAGRKYLVFVYTEAETQRIAASARIERFLDTQPHQLIEGQEVQIILWERTDLGYKAIIDHQFTGLLYANEVFETLRKGLHKTAYVSKVREDGKIDLRLLPSGYDKIGNLADQILEKLKNHRGFLALNDKSDAEEVYEVVGMSKKNFKKACGLLYKNRKINIEEKGIRLI